MIFIVQSPLLVKWVGMGENTLWTYKRTLYLN